MKIKNLIMALSFTGILGSPISFHPPRDIHKWVLEMHKAQKELLKVQWGNPGLCTRWSRDYIARAKSCARGSRTVIRGFKNIE